MRQRIRLRGLGDGFVSTSNFWQQLANQKVQYVLRPALPSPRLVPQTSLRGWLGADLPGDPTNPFNQGPLPEPTAAAIAAGTATFGPPNGNYVGDDGCVYDSNGNRLTCPGGIPPSPGGVNVLDLPQSPTTNQAGLIVLPLTVPAPPAPPAQPGVWQQFVNFLNSPLYQGSSIKTGYAIAGAVGLTLILSAGGRRR